MSRQDGLSQWIATVSTQMPHLSRPQARVLALWSFGMVVTQSCGLTTVAAFLALLLGKRPGTLRQQLREWCYAAADKKGRQRRAVEVAPCFGALLRWVLAWWPAQERRLVLAMDATTLGQRFTVLALSVVYRGCAIPVAWVVVPATGKGAWRPHWEHLFLLVQDSVPDDWTVLVLADRGLYARWLYRHIAGRGWHPFLRINQGGQFRPHAARHFRPLAAAAPRVGTGWSGVVDCFVTRECRLTCTLLARWEVPHAEPWLVLICGRYEGVDERVVEGLPAEEISIGDFVLAGGEVGALAVLEAVTRLVPGVVGKEESLTEESFESGLLDYPHYTRPRVFRGMEVPEELLSGDHARIAEWRRRAALEKTRRNRPDLIGNAPDGA